MYNKYRLYFTHQYLYDYLIISCCRRLYGDQAKYFEMEAKPRIKHKKKGTLSMVNNGNDMHGSQVEMIAFYREILGNYCELCQGETLGIIVF